MPGGKLDFGEKLEQGAARELLEETGMILGKSKVICLNEDIIETAHFLTVGFFSEDFSGEPKVMEPDEITEWGWFDLNDLPEPVFFPSAKILENYKRESFFIPDAA
jgi:8-oxo-dGTP diphosphatase